MRFAWFFTNEPCGLFEPGETICEECPREAIGLFDPVDDEYVAALCEEHMADNVSALAADLLLGKTFDQQLVKQEEEMAKRAEVDDPSRASSGWEHEFGFVEECEVCEERKAQFKREGGRQG